MRYEKPVINKLQSGMMNKFGGSPFYSRRVRSDIDGVSIADLVKNYGSPLYVFRKRGCAIAIAICIRCSQIVTRMSLLAGRIKPIT